ncbi:hypothetical protein TNCV_3884111 [Trichonephila clavipes]|nr:hypothetical protein TNCV_3884111 [Trichonephila clavipes]
MCPQCTDCSKNDRNKEMRQDSKVPLQSTTAMSARVDRHILLQECIARKTFTPIFYSMSKASIILPYRQEPLLAYRLQGTCNPGVR